VPAVKAISHLPILVDPSHGTGRRDKVAPLSRAAVAVGADGLMVEVHHDPDAALSDGPQSITPDMLRALVRDLRQIAEVVGRRL
jgi:3-deoxy-7-phosphoheptulonate synthase